MLNKKILLITSDHSWMFCILGGQALIFRWPLKIWVSLRLQVGAYKNIMFTQVNYCNFQNFHQWFLQSYGWQGVLDNYLLNTYAVKDLFFWRNLYVISKGGHESSAVTGPRANIKLNINLKLLKTIKNLRLGQSLLFYRLKSFRSSLLSARLKPILLLLTTSLNFDKDLYLKANTDALGLSVRSLNFYAAPAGAPSTSVYQDATLNSTGGAFTYFWGSMDMFKHCEIDYCSGSIFIINRCSKFYLWSSPIFSYIIWAYMSLYFWYHTY